MTKVARSREDLQSQLSEQLAFLLSSAESYDKGFFGEAKRLALTMRVLLHDTRVSHSLLAQLGRKNGQFLSTCLPQEPGNKATFAGLVMMGIGGADGGRHLPMGDEGIAGSWLPFADWWTETVILDDRQQAMSRSELVLTIANQDGGGHVDPELDESYARLTRENSLGWIAVRGATKTPVAEAAGASVRQIAHELMRSLDQAYSWKPKYNVGMFAGGMAVFDGPFPPGFQAAAQPTRARKIGRNQPCPCGSGKRFKKCHGEAKAA